jgi:hypothetical protein
MSSMSSMNMKKITSGVTTAQYQYPAKKALQEVVKTSQSSQTRLAAPSSSLAGVPGEPDHRHFLTAPFQHMIPIQSGNGAAVVGSIAYTTNDKAWRDYDRGRYQGIFAPPGEYDQKPAYFTYDLTTPRTPDHYLDPNKAVVTSNITAGPLSVRVAQETNLF